MRELHETAEAAGLLLQALDLRDRVVRGADDGHARIYQCIDRIRSVCRRQRQGRDFAEVVEPFFETEAHIGARLFARFGDMDRTDETPCIAVDRLTVVLCRVLADGPVGGEGIETAGRCRADRKQAQTVLACSCRTCRRDLACNGDLDPGARIGRHLQACVVELEPARFCGHRLAAQQWYKHVECLVHHVALPGNLDAHHEGVRWQGTGADTEHHATARDVVELIDAVGQHQRMVIGKRGNACAETNVLGALGQGGDEEFRARDQFIAGRVMLADPGFVVAELVHPLDKLDVALDCQCRVLVEGVEGGDESAEAHLGAGHLNGSFS